MDFKFLRPNAIAKAPNGDLVVVVTYWYHSLKNEWMTLVMNVWEEGDELDVTEWRLPIYPVSTLTYVEGGEPSFIEGICPYKTIKDVKDTFSICGGRKAIKMIFDERMNGIVHRYDNLQSLKSISKSGSKKAYRKRLRGALNKLRVKLN